MTKRNSQAATVVVPAVHAAGVDGKGVSAKTVVVPAEAEVASAKAEVKTDEAPVTVVADTIVALAAPAPMAMVAEPVAVAAEPAAASGASAQTDSSSDTDLTPYIVGGVLILGGVLAVALSSGDTDPIPVTPAPTNTAPTFTSATTGTVAENAAVATIVYDANAADTQGNAIVFTIGGTDAALFNIDASTGVVTLKASANFEAKSTYSFTVTATDNGSPALSATQTIAVTVTNVNEAPAFATATATATTPENIATTTVVFTASAVDPDVAGLGTPLPSPLPAGSAVTYTLGGTDATSFNINASTGAVTFRASPDFEAKASYTFTVTATDNGATPLSSTQTVTLNVTDVAEGPVFTSGATATIAENAAITTVVYDANTAGAATFALTGADAGAFNIDAATGIVTFRAPADFETKATYNINVVGTSAGGSTTQAVVVSVTNVNEAPAFAAATRTATFAENVAAGTTVIAAGGATDVDAGATVTYSLSGADATSFAVNATTGAVTFVASPNFEAKSSYAFNLVATDQGGLTATQANTVTITNVNETPTFAAATQAVTFAENGTGTVLTASAADVDAGATLTYSLAGADATFFAVNATTGVVTFVASPNFEAARSPVYTFNVVATDQGGLFTTQAETVTVTNVNERPVVTSSATATAIAENGLAGATVYTATATDPDANTTLTYALGGADSTAFAINATTGVVTILAPADFETKGSYAFTVTAIDNGNPALPSLAQAVTLAITDVPEGVRIDGGAIPAGTNTNFNAAVGNVTYLESAAAGNISTISNFTTGDIIQTDVATSSYSFSSVGTTLVISILSNGVSSQISLPGAAGSNFIFNEATAEQAVGFDFFRSSATPPPAATNNLDGAGSVASYNAANAANTYTDSANAPNITSITNFTSDDRIVATGVNGATQGTSYSFSSVDNNLVISFLGSAGSSQITLVGVANPNVFVFDEATAEQAVGFDFFRYG